MRRPETGSKLKDFGDLFLPEEAVEPILAGPVRGALLQWLTEIWAEDELAQVGVKARRKAMFDGPPGGGKTTLAHHLAARLGLPMLAVRPDKIIDCYLGSTGRNLGALFEAAGHKESPIVLFIDEFDALAPKRTEVRQGADQARNEMVNTLLQRLEQHDGFLIAATNHPANIDTAIWRRFDIHITLDLPGQDERERILARYLDPFGLPPRALGELAVAMETASPALMRQFCENLKRQIVIGPKLKLDMSPRAVVGRLTASCQPHPDLGAPRLWSLGADDKAVALMPWPLQLAKDVADGGGVEGEADPAAAGKAACEAGLPITANPYPFRDPRRPAWDTAWRAASDTDGMGPSAGVVAFPGKKS